MRVTTKHLNWCAYQIIQDRQTLDLQVGVGFQIQKRVAFGARKISGWRNFLRAHRYCLFLTFCMVEYV